MVLGQLFITDLTLSKRRLNEGIYKTLHNRAFAYYLFILFLFIYLFHVEDVRKAQKTH